MKTIQQIKGDQTEKLIAIECFKKNGYWAYITPKKVNGQPVDIIALKNNIIWLVDAKHIREGEKSFPFSRIEPNQIDSLNYAKQKGLKNIGFVICQDNLNAVFSPLFLSFDKLIDFMEKGLKSIKIELLEDFMEVLYACENKQ